MGRFVVGILDWAGRHRRGLARTLTAVTAALVLGVGGIALAGPAVASSWFGMCDADEHLPLVETPDTSTAGVSFGIETLDGMTVATLGGSDAGDPDYLDPTRVGTGAAAKTAPTSPASQLAGSGLAWYRYGTDCSDALSGASMTSWVGNTLLNALVVTPVRWLGLFLKFAFSTAIVDMLLSAVGPVAKQLTGNVFFDLLPLMIVAGGMSWIVKLLRSQGRQAAIAAGWAVLVIGIMAGLFTQEGVKAATAINDKAGQITTCVSFSAMGVPCDGAGGATFEGNVVETMATGTWGVGALGDIANAAIPEKLHVTKSGDVPHFDRDMDVTIPTAAIPARVDGQPTWAETLRWTQTLTASEKAAIAQNPDRACKATKTPTTDEITSTTPPGDLGVCGSKYLVRAAILSSLHQNNPAAYQQLVGEGNTIVPALNGVAVLIAALGIGAVGAILFFYQLKLVTSLIITPIAALISVAKFQAVKKWADLVLGTLLHRVMWGLILGIILWATGEVNATMTKVAVGWGMGGLLIPLATGIATIAVLVAGFAMWRSLKEMVADAIPATAQTNTTERVAEGGKAAAGIAVGAIAGGVSASAMGTSVAAGAARGAAGSGRGALGRATRALAGVRGRAGQPTASSTRPAGSGSPMAGEEAAQQAQASLAGTPEAVTAGARVRDQAAPRIKAAEDRAAAAKADLAAFDESPEERERVASRAAAFISLGNDPATALDGARRESEQRTALVAQIAQADKDLAAAQADAGFAEQKWAAEARRRIVHAMNRQAPGGGAGSVADEVATQLGVASTEGVAALRRMEHAERDRATLAYRGMRLNGGDS